MSQSKFVMSKDVEKARRLRKEFARQTKKRVELFWLSPDKNPDRGAAIFAVRDHGRWSFNVMEKVQS
jgi:hypothetical protein